MKNEWGNGHSDNIADQQIIGSLFHQFSSVMESLPESSFQSSQIRGNYKVLGFSHLEDPNTIYQGELISVSKFNESLPISNLIMGDPTRFPEKQAKIIDIAGEGNSNEQWIRLHIIPENIYNPQFLRGREKPNDPFWILGNSLHIYISSLGNGIEWRVRTVFMHNEFLKEKPNPDNIPLEDEPQELFSVSSMSGSTIERLKYIQYRIGNRDFSRVDELFHKSYDL